MSIYPKLEHIAMQSSSHRLKHIREIKRRLENEQEKRAGLYKKYRRAVNIIDGASRTLYKCLLFLMSTCTRFGGSFSLSFSRAAFRISHLVTRGTSALKRLRRIKSSDRYHRHWGCKPPVHYYRGFRCYRPWDCGLVVWNSQRWRKIHRSLAGFES